ncbi:MAG: sensor histidine kinase [Clostridiales bacterium]|nr:sensor histidine kinase [Clostridiales bacterium]
MKRLRAFLRKKGILPMGIQVTISISFTVVSICILAVLGVLLFSQFSARVETVSVESASQLLDQAAINLEDYLRSMRRISNAMYYSVIKDTDLETDTLDEEMNLLYEENKDNLISIACYTVDGELVAAAPVATEKQGVDIVNQEWFTSAMSQMENLHFSVPHVQNLFDDTSYRYYWVISLSHTVELTFGGSTKLGVLLVDMNYSSIEQLLSKTNTDSSSEYIYLMDNNGEIIYHPRQNLIYAGLYSENNQEALTYDDGSVEETFEGEKRLVTVKTISYTGWKLVSVVTIHSYEMGLLETQYFAVILVMLSLLAIIALNQMVSVQISKPLVRLNESVKELERGNLNPDIYVGGSLEIEHLGRTLRSTVEQLRQLMQDILVEQEEKRKSELDALQSQINPHFLYNTLDSIVWMIEDERYKDAIFMITELASLFRVSLSKGKNIIRLEEELGHARNYMNIQKVRYKNEFRVEYDIDPEILSCCIVKLVIQPLLENAIYYGVEGMDGEGVIRVTARRAGEDIYIEVSDNGIGMPPEVVSKLLTESDRTPKHGSGVGLVNVHKRIQLRFGQAYGLEIESHADEGTTARIHIPYIPYTEESRDELETGKRQV